MWLELDRRRPLQEQIFEQFRRRIRSGTLAPGAALPSSRELASVLGVSRNTVSLAYERLASEGYIDPRRGAGTFVSRAPPERCLSAGPVRRPQPAQAAGRDFAFEVRQHRVLPSPAPAEIDFWVQRPDPRSFPTKAWRRLMLECLSRSGSNLIDYGDPVGLGALRRAIAERVAASRGISTGPERVFIMAGAQLALNLVARLLLHPGAGVVIENPGNQGAAYLFESHRAALQPMPVDRHGLVTERLPAGGARLAYVTPAHQFPLGVTMSMERRLGLLRWAEAVDAYVVEDDYDGHFSYDQMPPPALAALDGDRVIHLGTFSKSLGAGLRIGYAIFPPSMVRAATAAKALLDNGQPWLDQAALTLLITRGGFARHVRSIRRTYRDRRDCLVDALSRHFGPVELTGASCGTHLCWHLPPGLPGATEMQALALARRVGVYTLREGGGEEYGEETYGDRVLMLGYAALGEPQIREGVARLREALRSA